ncbi:TrmJ/YjtD family RNA methyltransferase [Candidatus Micrarchaeota archaeon]|nr:TrmJ/YjtD family RNA methyltransferase [Candidatus Micrarchaeota archaeon]
MKKIKFKYIFIEPEGSMNLGAIARVLKNFRIKEFCIVNPQCEIINNESLMFAKHANDLLKKSIIYKDIYSAVKGCNYIVGTTGVLQRFKKTFRTPIALKEFKNYKHLKGEIAILFGREGVGLTQIETDLCDFLITIPTNKKYPIMNLSHSVAIIVYELNNLIYETPEQAVSEKEKEKLLESFNMLVDKFSYDMRNPKKVKIGFKRLVGRSFISSKEAVSILSVFRRTNKKIEK